MKRVCLLLLAMALIHLSFGQVVINEVVSSNSSGIKDPEFDQYSDWIELYNLGADDVDLGGYILSDAWEANDDYSIPQGTIISAGGYLLIWADGSGSGLHTDFSLDENGDQLILLSPDSAMLDYVSYKSMETDYSVGRSSGDANVWVNYSEPSPGEGNASGNGAIALKQVRFSLKSGFYDSSQLLELYAPVSGVDIRYTLDGSVPDASSEKYSYPVPIEENTVVKAIIMSSAYEPSRVAMRTYFIGERQSDFPVVSLGVDPYDFFDETTGMYSLGPDAEPRMPNYGANFWADRELPVTFEYFVGGDRKVDVNAGVKIFGNYSRRFDQRSLTINCRDEYGDERMRYQFFEDKDNDVFKQIILRNSGSDVMEPKYRDLMLQSLTKGRMDIDYQDGTPAIVYINGEYWGIMNIREKLQERYLKDNYGLSGDEVDLLANYWDVKNGTDEAFWTMFDDMESSNLSSDAVYDRFAGMMDMDEYLNYIITEIYVGNHDWPGGNIRYWKQTGDGHKWRWILYDLDQSFAYYGDCNEDRNTLADALSPYGTYWANNETGTLMMRRLFQNTGFRNEFIQRMCAHMNTTFSTARVEGFIDQFENQYSSEKQYHLERWGYSDSAWNAQHAQMVQFAQRRPGLMKGYLKSQFSLNGFAQLTIEAKGVDYAGYTIHSVAVEGKTVTGDYFENIPLKVVAHNQFGAQFVRWEDASGAEISADPELELSLTGDKTVYAVFQNNNGLDNIYINEFMAANAGDGTQLGGADWIELYNANAYPVDVAGLYFTDDLAEPLKSQIAKGTEGETKIPANGFLLFYADGLVQKGPQHLNMKLSRSGEQVGLSMQKDGAVVWIDSLSFGEQSSDVSFGRQTDGSDLFVFFDIASPLASNDGSIASGMEEVVGSFGVYPVPTNGEFTVVLPENISADISIVTASGQVVERRLACESQTVFDISHLQAGMYTIQSVSDAGVSEKLIVLQ